MSQQPSHSNQMSPRALVHLQQQTGELQLDQNLLLGFQQAGNMEHQQQGSQIENRHSLSRLPRATLEEKIHILNFYHRSGKLQSDTVEEFKNQFAISTSSFSEWLKHESELRERYNQSVSLAESSGNHIRQSKRKVRFKYEKINLAMDTLVERRLLDGLPINEPILRDHWAIYARQFGVDDPKRLYSFSHGWLSQFKKRHGLDKKTMMELNRRANSSSPSRRDENSNNDSRFYEVNQLLNSPQQLTGDNTRMGHGGNVDSNTRFTDPSRLNPQQQRPLQSQNDVQFNLLLSQVPGTFGNQAYPLIAPYIRLDNQVNRSNTSPTSNTNANQLLSSINNQQQQQQQQQQQLHLNPNQTLQLQMLQNKQIRNGSSLDNNKGGIINVSNRANGGGPNNNGIGKRKNNSNNGNNDDEHIHKTLLSGGEQIGDVEGRLSDLTGNDNSGIDSEMVSNVGSLSMMHADDTLPDIQSDDELFNISMEDIEKFMYQWCDKFFHDHQAQFPKTSKIFRTFKDSFMREKFKAMMMNGGSSSGRVSGKFPTEADDSNIDPNASTTTENGNNANISVDNFFLRNVQPRGSSQSRHS